MSRSGSSVGISLWKSSYCKKITAATKRLPWKIKENAKKKKKEKKQLLWRNCLDSCFLQLIFFLGACFRSNSIVSHQDPPRFLKFSLKCLVVRSSLRKKGKLAKLTTCSHTLWLIVPLVVHSLSIVFTRFHRMTYLSFHRRSFLLTKNNYLNSFIHSFF